MRKIAISDIHGHLKTFNKSLEIINFTKADQLFILGDLVGRGPDQAGLLDAIINLQNDEYNIICLMGNHENWLLNDVFYGRKKLHEKYLNFIKSMEFFHEAENFILVHAGFNLSKPFPPNDKKSMIEIFGWENSAVKNKWVGDRTVIYGHNVKLKSQIIQSIENNDQYIGIDNGVFVKTNDEKGSLCSYDFTSNKIYFQNCID